MRWSYNLAWIFLSTPQPTSGDRHQQVNSAMYSGSYGSRAGVGSGKRGHGGRNYRPPPERRDPDTAPPPLKQCSCLLEFRVPEYMAAVQQQQQQQQQQRGQPQQREGGTPRVHEIFGGRRALQECERLIRSKFRCHLVVPGRRQAGPVAVVGKTYRDALAAAHELLSNHLLVTAGVTGAEEQESSPVLSSRQIRGKIIRNVKDTNSGEGGAGGILGRWTIPQQPTGAHLDPYSLFESDDDGASFNVLACPLPSTTADSDKSADDDSSSSATTTTITTLQMCIDNAVFHLGQSAAEGLDIFVTKECAFCIGKREPAQRIYEEVRKVLG